MWGTLFLGALLLGAGPNVADIPIRGGTPAQQEQLRDVLATLPACFLRCADAPPKFQIRRSDDGAAAYDEVTRTVSISDVMFGGAAYDRHFEKLQQREPCLTRDNAAWLEDLPRALVHELSHHVHDTCNGGAQSGGGKLAAFLKLPGGYRDKLRRLQDDAELERLDRAAEEATKAGGTCAAEARIVHRIQELGFPSRGVGDAHANSDDGGGEYIAVAIETLAYDPAEFCRSYSKTEIQWLHANLGDCLGSLKNLAPCYLEVAAPKPPEVIDTLDGLMKATKPGTTNSGCDF